MEESERDSDYAPAPALFRGSAGLQQCGPWCRHYVPVDPELWPDFMICNHPLKSYLAFPCHRGHECSVGEPNPASGNGAP